MPKLEMGAGFKVLTYFIVLCGITGASFMAGSSYNENKQTESNIEVLDIDSDVAQKISTETQAKKEALDESIDLFKDPIIDSNGDLSVEFMQRVQSQKSDAEQRGNQAGYIYELTRP